MKWKEIIYLIFMPILLLVLSGCTKQKYDAKPGNLPTYNNITNSSARVVLAAGFDVLVNTTRLTNWLPPDPATTLPPPNGTTYFPTTGKSTNPFFIPQEFINNAGQATVKLYFPGLGAVVDSFVVQDNYYQPNDYYTAVTATGNIATVVVPRPPQTLTDPSHVRIRLLNVGTPTTGKISLAYANSTIVSAATSHIGLNSWSDYTEIPYGTYAFRVLQDSIAGLQLHGRPPAGALYTIESTVNTAIGGGQFYTPTITFQPGGVYTIAVSMSGGFQIGDAKLNFNTFSFITDNSPIANIQYGRVQVVNASVEGGIMIQIDGGATMPVSYTNASDYQVLTNGAHNVKITNASGSVLGELKFSIIGGDNISLWTYTDANGKTSIIPIANNMGGIQQLGTNNDGSDPSNLLYDPLKYNMIAQTRFLNLCPDIPYVTFTTANGALFADNRFSSSKAAQNLPSGVASDPVNVPFPYVDLTAGSYNSIQAYQSQPDIVPGNRLINVAALQPAAFSELPATFYPQDEPSIEPGVYTVALIGRNNGTANPRLMVIKHNR